jgi:hypothetical protein
VNGICPAFAVASLRTVTILSIILSDGEKPSHEKKTNYIESKQDISKGVLGLSKHNRSRFVYALLDFDLFVSDLKQNSRYRTLMHLTHFVKQTL